MDHADGICQPKTFLFSFLEEDESIMAGWSVIDHDQPRAPQPQRNTDSESPGFFAALSSTKWVGDLYNFCQRRKPKLFARPHALVPAEAPTFSTDVINFLGHFEAISPTERKKGSIDKNSEQFFHAIRFLDYVSANLIWFSYRREFPIIPTYEATSDIGWGCLIRTTQMMLARVLCTLHEQDDALADAPPKPKIGKFQIIQWFQDIPSPSAPYSIHNIIQESILISGGVTNRHLTGGEWFSPTRVALIFERLVSKHAESGIRMVLAKDTVIPVDQVETPTPQKSNTDSNSSDTKEEPWVPVWILIPTLLGLGKTSEMYSPHLRHSLSSLHSCGVIGGKPKASLYFIGVQGSTVFYLDPHIVQKAVKPSPSLDAKAYNTYKCAVPSSIPMKEMDPSIAVGIFCPTRLDWERFKLEHKSFEESGLPLIFSLARQS